MAFPDDERAGAWVNLLQVSAVVQSAIEQRLKASADLSLAEFEVLVRLSTAPEGRLKMIEIANLLLTSKSGVTRIIDRLEQDGLVARQVPPENRRIVHALLTPAGLQALVRARPVFIQALGDSFSRHLSDTEVRTLRRVLHKLLVGNGVWEEERCSLNLEDVRELATAGTGESQARLATGRPS
jgi:DNA-binding MarR family transcriptional regulator